MLFRYLLILFSVLGISSTFMPWLHYPKPNLVVYGYLSDGIITGFLFLLTFIFSLYSYRKARFNQIGGGLVALMGLWMGFEAYGKIMDIEAEKLSFSTDDPIIALSTAGFHQGIGIYVMGIAGIGLFITIAIALLFQYFHSGEQHNMESTKENQRKEWLTLLSSLGLFAICVYFLFLGLFQSKPDAAQLKKSMSHDVEEMGKAIVSENYEKFVTFNHPMMIQSYGGKQRTKDLLKATLTEIKKSGYKVKNAELSQVHDIQFKQNNLQAIISQKLTLDSMNKDKIQIQKMIAISENNGASWYFINIDGKSREEIKSVFPLINPSLKY